jgi:hypothetical protein
MANKKSLVGIFGMVLVFGLIMAGLILVGCGTTRPQPNTAVSSAQSLDLSTVTTSSAQSLDLSTVTTWYVRADGSDQNSGASRNAPFKTLSKAVSEAAKTAVKTITVIGELAGDTKITNSGSDEILITGKALAPSTENAVLIPAENVLSDGVFVEGNSNIRLEQITITGHIRGMLIEGSQARVTLGTNVVISGNGRFQDETINLGGGIFIDDGGGMILCDNATITGNIAARRGGGVYIQKDGFIIMQDSALITNNAAGGTGEWDGGGGVWVVTGSTLTMRGNAVISDNKAVSGGGVFVGQATLIMEDNASIKNNTANVNDNSLLNGGGGVLCNGALVMTGNSSITANTAAYGGGVYLKMASVSQEALASGGGTISGNMASKEGPDFYENNK